MQPSPALREIDHQFARFLTARAALPCAELTEVAGLVSAAVGDGHVCLDLPELYGREADALGNSLLASGVVGEPGSYTPLVLDRQGRLYLYRYWHYQHDLARRLKIMLEERPPLDLNLLADGLERMIPKGRQECDWQRVAAVAALHSRFCVISGGPGTGKTTTVAAIMALLLEQPGGEGLRLALTAPTGKAAGRLKESLQSSRQRLTQCSPAAERLPQEVTTLHRLLGVIPDSSRFRHHTDNPLPYDVVVVDEASMVPLPLMAKLVQALAPHTRLILLGDRDQLASVEAGAVLGDICDTGQSRIFSRAFAQLLAETASETVPPEQMCNDPVALADSIVVLQHNYRFTAQGGIGALSRAINSGDAAAALALLRIGGEEVWREELPERQLLPGRLEQMVVEGFRPCLESDDPAQALRLFDRFRVLCATRQGSYGVSGLNRAIEACLAAKGLISTDRTWYRGRPVMVLANDYTLRLFNGDVGLTLPDPFNPGQLAVFFPAPDGALRRISPSRLPHHETVYAMTVHKSQGSEFQQVLLVMPPGDSPLLTRELLYTGLTRARTTAGIWAGEEQLVTMIGRTVSRRSGLRQALWENGETS